jgi:hypothetical protein
MEETLWSLNDHLEKTFKLLQSPKISKELHAALHNHEPGLLPSVTGTALANRSIDLLHQIEQLLEPGHLVLADHFLGMMTKPACNPCY